jgi:pimeloyl-ACP methyl ester carboxylesterase
MEHSATYRTIDVDGLPIFYRQAGPAEGPILLLLHGLPSSSRMYEPLLTRLSDRYRLIAPDYPGFGHSAWPAPTAFAYTFDHLAEVMIRLRRSWASHATASLCRITVARSASAWPWRIPNGWTP